MPFGTLIPSIITLRTDREDAKYTAKEEFSTTTIIDLFKIPTMEVSLIA